MMMTQCTECAEDQSLRVGGVAGFGQNRGEDKDHHDKDKDHCGHDHDKDHNDMDDHDKDDHDKNNWPS